MLWIDIVFCYVCPSLGCLMSAAMYAAPVQDLQRALLKGKLESLNPVPWAVMSGNCLGWCAYGYYIRDPFMLASNVPGLVLSIWLNLGAAKLQYHNQIRMMLPTMVMATDDLTTSNIGESLEPNHRAINDELLFVPQETLVLRILVAWIGSLIVVGWSGWIKNPTTAIGILVNVNLIFFYGAPLQTMRTVLLTKSSNSIHRPTIVMNSINTLFWLLYGGLARHDPVIYGPNIIGLVLGIVQAFLTCWYPQQRMASNGNTEDLQEPLLSTEETYAFAATEEHRQQQDEAQD